MTMKWSLLHLTDLHLGDVSNWVDDDKEGVAPEIRESNIRRFRQLLNCKSLQTVDAMAVTGDITSRGDPAGFSEFKSLAPSLLSLVRRPSAVCIVPGNHDVKWDLEPNSPKYYEEKFAGFTSLVESLGATTCLLPRTHAGGGGRHTGSNDFDLPRSPLSPLYIDQERHLIVACINSAIRCGEVNLTRRNAIDRPLNESLAQLDKIAEGSLTDHQGAALKSALHWLDVSRNIARRQTLFDVTHATQAQRIALSDALSDVKGQCADWDQFLRVAILHHHLLPYRNKLVEHKPFDLMLDSTNVLELLDGFDFHLVLTGHQHQPYMEEYSGRRGRILLLGGPTVGGYPVANQSAGYQQVSVERESSRRIRVRVAHVPLRGGADNPVELIETCLSEASERYIETMAARRASPVSHMHSSSNPGERDAAPSRSGRDAPPIPIYRSLEIKFDWFRMFEESMSAYRPQLDSSMLYYGPGLATNWIDISSPRKSSAYRQMHDELRKYVPSLMKQFHEILDSDHVSVVDLGIGDCERGALVTRRLLDMDSRLRVDHVSVDISYQMLELALASPHARQLMQELQDRNGRLLGLNAPFSGLSSYRQLFTPSSSELDGTERRGQQLFLLLGNTLGNEANEEQTLRVIVELMQPNDRLLVEVQLVEREPRTAEQVLANQRKSPNFYFGPFTVLGCPADKLELTVSQERRQNCLTLLYGVHFRERYCAAHIGLNRPIHFQGDVGIFIMRKYDDDREAFEALFGAVGLTIDDYHRTDGEDRRFAYIYAKRDDAEDL